MFVLDLFFPFFFFILQNLPVHLKLIFLFPDIFCFIHLMLDQSGTIKDEEKADLVKVKSEVFRHLKVFVH